ncbi:MULTISPECIES: class I SAM-dependent DNA methyltransferase [Oceanobacillus]|uniref:Class I SAM-dependent methyltransferase n=1 Tax=Oceanobacillus profundus TaxID=372463 RepID=A0A417YJ80_9BACI|nr:class I SAM-dependent methyltransferase [Oceanobacillus profundus]MBR3120203.1 class I SAM-dependent methyltransferase [Oceanobacillus sp.]MCM3396884.1 class I SAM-dependent methyltransferase [Oceanobacillus profundus]PAE31086.1 SAM-dependent methyltransferase [Paenibacillus sp. 7884-2]RHW33126.1 class I SAM-dependent methyltransferase [Oceanobacillus profundus]
MAYQQMASLYDQLMVNAPYDAWVSFTEEMIKQTGKEAERIADLGCGTGEIATRLAERGYHITGVDYSTEMLTHAAHKAEEKNLSIQWIHQDLTKLTGLFEYDVAISYCDVMNYITEPMDLQKSFHNIANCLKEGGLFIFDVHSLSHVEKNYMNQTFAEVTDEASYIWFCSAGDDPGEMFHDLTFFALEEETYKRFDEFHHQKTYPVTFYKKILKESGFENIKLFADFSTKVNNVDENSERIFFLAEKRSG